nr:protein bfr2-like [Lolium perenne]
MSPVSTSNYNDYFVSLFNYLQSAAEPAVTVEGKTVEGDPQLIDDSEFYHILLKDFLESCDGASESAFYALRKKQHKKRKLIDRRASKSRKIRYNVHEKLANLMAPVPITVPRPDGFEIVQESVWNGQPEPEGNRIMI